MVRANIELKARCPDPERARARAEALATQWVGLDLQVDTYFSTRAGRLKLRESSRSGAQLVPYLRSDEPSARRSDYQVIPVDDPEGTKTLLTALLGLHAVVRKRREIALVDNVRIHLDRVEGLGDFLELEAVFDGNPAHEKGEHEKVARLANALGIRESDRIESSYEALIRGR